jgi:polyhydroxyalkanoate synthesis regulator phasin
MATKTETKAKGKGKKKSGGSADSSRTDQSVQAFRDALEKSVTISRDRLQDVIDDAVRRGRMTRTDADEIVGRLITRGRDQADDLIGQLERLLAQLRQAPDRARQEVGGRAQKARQQVETSAERARKRAVKELDKPLAGADRVRRAARVPGFPITAYDDLSVRQVDRRLEELSPAQLRKVRDYERRNKSRKGVLQAVERKLDK